jgi:hypothetical protein
MASVQELILAAQAKQKPQPLSQLAQLVNAASSGYSEGITQKNVNAEAELRKAQVVKQLVEAHQAQQEMDSQAAMLSDPSNPFRKQVQETLGAQAEQALREKQAAVGAPKPPTTPAGKFETTWSQDEKGRVSRSVKEVSPKQADVPSGYRTKPDGSMEFIPGGPADPTVRTKLEKLPTGFQRNAAGDLEPIPGGPADIKAQQDKEKADIALANQTDKAKSINASIDGAMTKVNNWSAGAGGALAKVPLTQAKSLAVDLQHIKSMLGIDQLTEMKSQSKTGASGFGQLSDRELEVITSAVANLDQTQDPEQLKKSLGDIKTHYQNWLDIQAGKNPYDASGGAGGNETPAQRKARLISELQGAKH